MKLGLSQGNHNQQFTEIKYMKQINVPYFDFVQDRFVPINNIGRTMRNGIPKSGKVT